MKTQRTKIKIAILSLGAFSLLLLFGLESCRKYEEGPSISFRSKEKRLMNSWIFDKIIENGNDISVEFQSDPNNVHFINLSRNEQLGNVNVFAESKNGDYIYYNINELEAYKKYQVTAECWLQNCTLQYNAAQPENAQWEIIILKEDYLGFKTQYGGSNYKLYLKSGKP